MNEIHTDLPNISEIQSNLSSDFMNEIPLADQQARALTPTEMAARQRVHSAVSITQIMKDNVIHDEALARDFAKWHNERMHVFYNVRPTEVEALILAKLSDIDNRLNKLEQALIPTTKVAVVKDTPIDPITAATRAVSD